MTKTLKSYMVILPLSAMTLVVSLPEKVEAQVAIVEVIKAGVKRVIRAVDLKIQRLQNKTLWLQNAQQALENQLSRLKLAEIAEWTARQGDLYEKYYRELWEIKTVLLYYRRVRQVVELQGSLVAEYEQAWGLLRGDPNFSAQELAYMESVYRGMLDASIEQVDQLLLIVSSFKTRMSDAERLEMIERVAEAIAGTLSDLRRFNARQAGLSIARGRSEEEVKRLKELYDAAE